MAKNNDKRAERMARSNRNVNRAITVLMAGVIAHNAAGERIVGICVAKEFNVDGSVVRLVDVPSRTMQQEGTTLKLSPAAINEHTLTI